jgi:hypothetical protein
MISSGALPTDLKYVTIAALSGSLEHATLMPGGKSTEKKVGHVRSRLRRA